MLSFKLSVCYPQSFYLSPPPIAFYLFNLFHVVSFYLSLSEISLPVIFCVIIIFFSFAGTFHLPAVISPTCIFYEIIPTIQITAQSTFIWTGQALILFGWNILMDMWRHSNIISVGTGRIMHRLPFVWITVAMMYLTWMMYTSEEID